MHKKQIIIRNPLEKIQDLISYSIPFKLQIDVPIIIASLLKPDGKKETKPPTDDLKNVVDWLWWKSKKHYPDKFEDSKKVKE